MAAGIQSSKQIIAAMDHTPVDGCGPEFLHDRLISDCAAMMINTELTAFLAELRTEAFIVLATDNIDCFADTFREAAGLSRPWHTDSATLADTVGLFDGLISSSDVGVRKEQDPQSFFGRWLETHGLPFASAVLIDDKVNNCNAFQVHGGTSLHWDSDSDELADLRLTLSHWIERLPEESRQAARNQLIAMPDPGMTVHTEEKNGHDATYWGPPRSGTYDQQSQNGGSRR